VRKEGLYWLMNKEGISMIHVDILPDPALLAFVSIEVDDAHPGRSLAPSLLW
jgi:hypothetical protein